MDKDQRAEGREVPEVWLIDTWDGGVNLSHVREDYVKAFSRKSIDTFST
jgi:hypothetical protein